MPDSSNTVIGYLVDVQGNLLMATLVEDDQGHAPIVTIGDEDILVGQLGSYVTLPMDDRTIIGFVVGASFAVLVAEELFASGCRLLINVTSSGQIVEKEEPPFFLLVDKSLRDEGTSYHYLPPSDYAHLDERLLEIFEVAFKDSAVLVYRGSTWTTDAPFRETEAAIEQARRMGIRAVEMESAALYAFAKARSKPVVSFAHVTNRMGNVEGDFEKGEASGSQAALQLIAVAARAWLLHDET